ncbi:MAG TPA: hypothetical protein ENL20_07320 [Candidatus Cloacimonetes bacterium]|nr:hypothetical protein [Candidatus Cloacimonadota bacterium]
MLKIENYELLIEMTKVFQKAIKKAQQSHRDKGIPNVYSKNGRIVWELPDGSYINKNPFDRIVKNIN